MADLRVKELDLQNPFIIAASPATHGVKAVLKSSNALPGAVVMRNYGHGCGGGTFLSASAEDMYTGKPCFQNNALGKMTKDYFSSFEEYCEAVSYVRSQMPEKVKLWVSVGQYTDVARLGPDWEDNWAKQAKKPLFPGIWILLLLPEIWMLSLFGDILSPHLPICFILRVSDFIFSVSGFMQTAFSPKFATARYFLPSSPIVAIHRNKPLPVPETLIALVSAAASLVFRYSCLI